MDRSLPSLKVLVAPLDWGLGHATRCIPVIRELLLKNCTVFLAADGKVKAVLEAEFPHLRLLHLQGYHIRYASTWWGLPFKIVAQIPGMMRAIRNEQKWLEKVVEREGIDVVISDNRFGLHHPKIRSVFITHQLQIKAPLKIVEDFLQKINYGYMNRFDECWVPDAAGTNNLAGELAHPATKPKIPLRYVGALSRFTTTHFAEEGYILIILSGPEPQRTLLENLLLEELKTYKGPVVLVRGLPMGGNHLQVPANVLVHNHLPAQQLAAVMGKASLIISRCGYSTIMDVAALQKQSILIPTPGQTEQEYLARHLMKKNFALCIEQRKFRLKTAIALARSFSYSVYDFDNRGSLSETVQRLLDSVKAKA